jgi:serine protease Do
MVRLVFRSVTLLLCLHVPLLAEDAAGPIQDLIAKVRPSIATIRVTGRDGDELSMGTGFVIESEGLIATNFHVINEGRSFTVEMSSGRKLPVLSIEASDRDADLALVRVDVNDKPLAALKLAGSSAAKQGLRVLAFGNPLGLRNSVVEGIVSAVREVDGRQLIQLAMPIERGNSGGPLVDYRGRVHGIVNLKSAIDQNLGFAIPIDQLQPLRSKPNPVAIDRWVLLGRINEEKWLPIFGAQWQLRGGVISARGMGMGFGGRSLCLSTQTLPEPPYEIAVNVRLDDESGAAGLAFCSDGKDRHYGFYPSDGQLRLTCFHGPTVYQWQVLHESSSPHYLPEQWNHLRVRVEQDGFQCFVNDELVVRSTDQQLKPGRIGLVKFRDTNPDFKTFRIGPELRSEELSESARQRFADLRNTPEQIDSITTAEIEELGKQRDAASPLLLRRAGELEQQAARIRSLAADIRIAPVLTDLRELFAGESDSAPEDSDADDGNADPSADDDRLLRGALLIASLDDVDIDVDAYVERVDEMASEVRERLDEHASEKDRLAAIDRYLFKENGFHGGRSEYYHPANSRLNRVIDDREGLPITLSILYIELGRRLGLRIDGIGLPGHFVVNHIAADGSEQLVDVFDGGKPMSKAEADALVRANVGRNLVNADLDPQSASQILTRVLRNLMGIAGDKRDGESLLRYAGAMVAIDSHSAEFRMMRAQLRSMTDRRGLAIEDLQRLLQEDPPGLNAAAAQQLLDALLDPN